MLEGFRENFEVEDFPEITFILSAVIFAVFLFTQNNLSFYEDAFGFIPASPQIYSLITYTFIHASFDHVLFNILFLVIAGIVLEETVGSWAFLAIYFSSGFFAVLFDILGRFLTGFFDIMNNACAGSVLACTNFGGPFIGASGSIFGVMAVASMIKPQEKIPTILVVLALIPFVQLYAQYQAHIEYFTSLFVTATVLILALTIFFLSPGTVPIFVGLLAFLFSWIFVILLGIGGSVSNVGHLGGVLGGLISYFIFTKIKRT
jgi:membrane associated rhomboid family serine protease